MASVVTVTLVDNGSVLQAFTCLAKGLEKLTEHSLLQLYILQQCITEVYQSVANKQVKQQAIT